MTDEDLETLTYEQLVDRLEKAISRMADGTIGIEEAADLYEQAGRLHEAAAERLERIRSRIEALTQPIEGQPKDA